MQIPSFATYIRDGAPVSRGISFIGNPNSLLISSDLELLQYSES